MVEKKGKKGKEQKATQKFSLAENDAILERLGHARANGRARDLLQPLLRLGLQLWVKLGLRLLLQISAHTIRPTVIRHRKREWGKGGK